jgi:hypothetical protein
MNTENIKAILASYGRTFVSVVLFAAINGETDVKAILLAGAVAVVGPAIRAINPNDPTFGRVADTLEAEVIKAAKKAASKKKTK